MQIYVFFSTHLLSRILNDALHYRPVVEVVLYIYVVKFISVSKGRAPVEVLGQKPPSG